jgi:hypothetical protein
MYDPYQKEIPTCSYWPEGEEHVHHCQGDTAWPHTFLPVAARALVHWG